MTKWSWENLAREQAKALRRRTDGHAHIDFRIQDNRIEMLLVSDVNRTFTFDKWENVYNAIIAMNEAYLLGFKWGL